MVTITWAITQTDYATATGFITTAHWTCTAVDGAHVASIYSTCSWQLGTPVIAYANVTMPDVIDWCWSSGVDKQATEAALAQKIALLKNPVIAAGLPWAA